MKQTFTQSIVFFYTLFLVAGKAAAQDPRFSQYYAAPVQLNPAMTGVFNGQYRATINYRDQWSSVLSPNPFRTYSVSGEYRRAVASDDYIGFSVAAMHDEVGVARYRQDKAHLGIAFLKQLAGGRYRKQQYLSAGIQAGLGQNSIDYSRLWFSRQYDIGNEAIDFGAGNGEDLANASTPTFLDLNAGLLYYIVLDNDGFFYVGATGHHLNQPRISMLQSNNFTLYRRWSGHVGGQLPTSENFSILPGAQVMVQGPSMEIDLGANVRYSNNDLNELALRAGAWMRVGNKFQGGIHPDAVTIVTMLELSRVMVGLSYDLTVSTLRRANNARGAFEISLSYFHPERRRSRVNCPRF
jgi:type IX secretion system PorP/SprF family membrane protein